MSVPRVSLKQILNAAFLVPLSSAVSLWEASVIGNSDLFVLLAQLEGGREMPRTEWPG